MSFTYIFPTLILGSFIFYEFFNPFHFKDMYTHMKLFTGFIAHSAIGVANSSFWTAILKLNQLLSLPENWNKMQMPCFNFTHGTNSKADPYHTHTHIDIHTHTHVCVCTYTCACIYFYLYGEKVGGRGRVNITGSTFCTLDTEDLQALMLQKS